MYIVTLVLVSPRLFKDVASSAFEYSRDRHRQAAQLFGPGNSAQRGGTHPSPPPSPIGGSVLSGSTRLGGGGGFSERSSDTGATAVAGAAGGDLDLWKSLDGAVRFGSDMIQYHALLLMFYLQTFMVLSSRSMFTPLIGRVVRILPTAYIPRQVFDTRSCIG